MRFLSIFVVCGIGGEGSVYKKTLHLAVIIRGGKVTLATNNMGGRRLTMCTSHGFSELNSCHAECAVIDKLTARRERDKWLRKINKCRVYSLAFRYCTHTHSLRPSSAKPCRMCTNLLRESGFREVWYSEMDGALCWSSIATLQQVSKRSFGERRLEWARHTQELRLARQRGELVTLYLRDLVTFRNIENGNKSIEGRLWRGVIRRLRRGQFIIFRCDDNQIPVYLTFVRRFHGFREMLCHGDGSTLARTVPDAKSVDEGVERYNFLYSRRDQRRYDAVAIGFTRVNVNLSVNY